MLRRPKTPLNSLAPESPTAPRVLSEVPRRVGRSPGFGADFTARKKPPIQRKSEGFQKSWIALELFGALKLLGIVIKRRGIGIFKNIQNMFLAKLSCGSWCGFWWSGVLSVFAIIIAAQRPE